MRVTYNWLSEFVDIDVSPTELAHMLTMAGLEVEAIEQYGEELDNITVSEILEIGPHPNAEKLVVCRVDDGETKHRQIVCGAKNMKAGDRVPLAKPGAVLKSLKDGETFKLKKSKLRGIESDGMLCSDVELGLGTDAKGLMILPEDMEIGQPIADALELRDTAYEIAVMPNRPDVASVIGIAREVGAILDKPVKNIEPKLTESGKDAGEWSSVEILDYDLCPRYAAKIITDVIIKPSPTWMVTRLERCGVRAINNLVDITNYVLLETGHPLHAFDYEKLAEKRIVVRRAKDTETLITLDGETRNLTSQMLVIADAKKAVALAGIMGGANTEVDEKTRTVLLESAYFKPPNIRRTSKTLGLQSEASYRFERGADPTIQVKAADRVCELISSTDGGTVQKGVIDNKKKEFAPKPVKVRVSRTNKVLGTRLSASEIESIFRRLNFPIAAKNDDGFVIVPPSYRVDLEREIDLIEEVARVYGYDNIPTPVSVTKVLSHEESPVTRIENLTKESFTSFGFYEVINCNLISRKSLERTSSYLSLEEEQILEVLNPVSVEHSIIRPTLIPGMLETIQTNINHNQCDLRLFELGHAHIETGANFPIERLLLTYALSGKKELESWNSKPGEVDFYDLKGVLEEFLEIIGAENAEFKTVENELFVEGCTAEILLNGERVGILGEIHPRVLKQFDIDQQVFLGELDIDEMRENAGRIRSFKPLSVFPSTSRDIAIILDNHVTFDIIRGIIIGLRIPILERIKLFDVYRGEQVGKGKKSMAFSLQFRSRERTLRDSEVDRFFQRIKTELIEKVNCTVREG